MIQFTNDMFVLQSTYNIIAFIIFIKSKHFFFLVKLTLTVLLFLYFNKMKHFILFIH